MSDMAILAVWFASIIAGMMLTLLMPVMFADSHVKEAPQDECAHVTSQEILHVEAQNVHL
jgi:hypothetical protein